MAKANLDIFIGDVEPPCLLHMFFNLAHEHMVKPSLQLAIVFETLLRETNWTLMARGGGIR